MTVDEVIDSIIEREGAVSNQKADRGGLTKWGITLNTLSAYLGRPATPDELLRIPLEDARELFKAMFIDRTAIGKLPEALVPFMADFAVNSGPGIAIQALQESLGVQVDHKLGAVTLAAACGADAQKLLLQLIKWRVMMLTRIVRKDPSQLVFLAGWLSRVLSFI